MENCKYCNKVLNTNGDCNLVNHYRQCNEYKIWRDTTFNYEFLYHEYVENGKSALQIANENGFSSSSVINKQLRRIGIDVRNVKQSHYMPQYKVRIESTNLERYGAINPLSKGTTPFSKKQDTVINKYGVDNIFASDDVKRKIKNKIIDKYGAISILHSNHINHNKYVSELIYLYGVDNIMKLNENRRKVRLATIRNINERIERGVQIQPNYNKNAIDIIERYGTDNGYTFQHAENGGEFYIKELGYWVDGYDIEKNVVIEIDEKHHFDTNGELCERDIIRQSEIVEKLKCTFIRIKYEDYINNKS